MTRLVLALAAVAAGGCELLPIFEPQSADCCGAPGVEERVACGACGLGVQVRVCGDDHRWRPATACADNPYDLDGDGFANDQCFQDQGADAACCGERDCDDGEARRYPDHGDVDGDERVDARCCTEAMAFERCDCDDDDPEIWNGRADRDRDGHTDTRCCLAGTPGCDDCDDSDPARWAGNADSDGDGHTDERCCLPDTPMCDDCDDRDPLRWRDHADLDGDGHVAESCGGDDCDDWHPRRWRGNADADGDGHVDDRCCLGLGELCDDCDDNDPRRWAGHADLDGDGFDPALCGGTDCDDACASCYPFAPRVTGDGLDHDCDGAIDDRQQLLCEVEALALVASLDTGDSRALAAVGDLAYVGSGDGLFEVALAAGGAATVRRSIDVGRVADVAVAGDLVYCATALGLVIVDRSTSPDLLVRSGPLPTGDSRGVEVRSDVAHVASFTGVHLVDASSPDDPVIFMTVAPQSFHDARDVALVPAASTETLAYDVCVTARAETGGWFEGIGRAKISYRHPLPGDDAPPRLSYELLEAFVEEGVGRLTYSQVGARAELYLSAGDGIDVLRPEHLVVTETLPLAGARGVFPAHTSSRRVLFAAGDGGLSLYDDAVGGSYQPVPGAVPWLEPSRDVLVHGDVVLVATDSGLRVLSLECE
jgi:hypothetical protein